MAKIKPITLLIDPDDTNLQKVISIVGEQKNTIQNKCELRIGCSSSTIQDLYNAITLDDRLSAKDFTLFPGTLDQISHAEEFQSSRLPHPFPNTDSSKSMLSHISQRFGDICKPMAYVLLNTECTAAKKLKISTLATEKEIWKFLEDFLSINDEGIIYLEGGSRSQSSLAQSQIVYNIRKRFSDITMIYGGGIGSIEDIEKVINHGMDSVVVSHFIHQYPSKINEILRL